MQKQTSFCIFYRKCAKMLQNDLGVPRDMGKNKIAILKIIKI